MKKYLLLSAAALMLMTASAHAENAKPGAPGAKSAVDSNNDGVITKVEADAVSERDFAAFDANKDGKISKDEFQALIFKTNANVLKDDAAKKRAEPEIAAQLKMLDSNKDGNIDKTEFKADSTRRFKTMDENGDGKVTKAEVESVSKKIRAAIEKMKEAQTKKGEAAPAKK